MASLYLVHTTLYALFIYRLCRVLTATDLRGVRIASALRIMGVFLDSNAIRAVVQESSSAPFTPVCRPRCGKQQQSTKISPKISP